MKKAILTPLLFLVFLFFSLFMIPSSLYATCWNAPNCASTDECNANPAKFGCWCWEPPCSYTCQTNYADPAYGKVCYVTEEPSTTLCPDDKWCPWGVCNYQDPFWLQTRFCCDPNITEYQIRQCRSDGEPGCPDDMTGNFDGVCGQCEDASSCSSDCGGCIPIRGDGECNCGETPNSCFLL
jgi:hypothetical protein